jgi:hypothetical protein
MSIDTISVPITLVSLSAAISARVATLTPESESDDVAAIIRLVSTLERTLDRLALAFEPVTKISTVAA